MRKFLIAVGILLVGVVGLSVVFWDDLVSSYQEAVAFAGEVAVETGKEMGRMSYHSLRCGDPSIMDEMQTAVDQLDQSSDFQASMKGAFYQGVDEAKAMDMEYTEAFCLELAQKVEDASNN